MHWIYWVGPGMGAMLATGVYKLMKMLQYEHAVSAVFRGFPMPALTIVYRTLGKTTTISVNKTRTIQAARFFRVEEGLVILGRTCKTEFYCKERIGKRRVIFEGSRVTCSDHAN